MIINNNEKTNSISIEDKEVKIAIKKFVKEAQEVSLFSKITSDQYPKDTMAADYYVELINLYKETKSLDNVEIVMNAYKSDPKVFAQIEFEKAFVLQKYNDSLTMHYLSRKTDYDLENKKDKLSFMSTLWKILMMERRYLMDHSTDEKKNRIIEMTNHFHDLYENAKLSLEKKIK